MRLNFEIFSWYFCLLLSGAAENSKAGRLIALWNFQFVFSLPLSLVSSSFALAFALQFKLAFALVGSPFVLLFALLIQPFVLPYDEK